jgi:hypothetical protein
MNRKTLKNLLSCTLHIVYSEVYVIFVGLAFCKENVLTAQLDRKNSLSLLALMPLVN